jgi:hypothetical protein
MYDYLFAYISKPFMGLAILVRLFGNPEQDSNGPSVTNLKFVHTSDSVFVQAEIRNGLTPEIRDLIEGGVVVRTACTFTCGPFSKYWERELQYNPVKRVGSCRLPDGTSVTTFKEDDLAFHFNYVEFYLAGFDSVRAMQSKSAKIQLSTSIKIEAMAIGKKELWPNRVVADFSVPQLSRVR